MSSYITAPYALSGTSGASSVTPVVFQSLNTTIAASATSPYSQSSIVQLSTWGRVLGAGVSLATSIQSLQVDPATATPSSVVAKAQDFVSAFAYTQNSLNSVQTSSGTAFSSALINQFSKTLNAAASSAASADTTNLASLQSIGITEQVLTPQGVAQATATLAIDQTALNAAATANPAQTLGLLTKATQPLLQEVSTFESLATRSEALSNDLSSQELTNLAQNQPTASSALTYLDLAKVLANDNSKNKVLSMAVNAAAEATSTLITATAAADVTDTALPVQVPSTMRKLASSVATSATTATAQTAVVAVSQDAPVLPALATTVSADSTAQIPSAATRELQQLVADPTATAIDNNVLNPFYATVSASYRQDAVMMQKPVAPTTLSPDIPAPVAAVDRVHGINGYNEMDNGSGGH